MSEVSLFKFLKGIFGFDARKDIIIDFCSREWTGEQGADKEIDTKIEVYQLTNNYKFFREISRWNERPEKSANHVVKASTVLFSDDLVEVLDAKDEVMKLLLNQAIDLLPHLLLSPNQEIRKLAEKFTEHKKIV